MTIRNPPRGTWAPSRRRGSVDPAAVERLLAGSRVTTTVDDRAAALDHADRHGATAVQIAERLGCSVRTVTRRRAARRATTAAPDRRAARAQEPHDSRQ